MIPGLRTYTVKSSARKPLIDFMTSSLEEAGCVIVHQSAPDRAPFFIVAETVEGERFGIVAYAFLATRTPTLNRPDDERSFQIKYGPKDPDNNSHELWSVLMGMFTTVLLGIDPDEGFVVSAHPIVHSPTKFYIRLEFKDEHADQIADRGLYAGSEWKCRETPYSHRIETLVGATKQNFLKLLRFERAARGLDPGNRLLLAENYASQLPTGKTIIVADSELLVAAKEHPLAKQLALSPDQILTLIEGTRRLKMAVRGWVAEEHLRATFSSVSEVTHCERLDEEGGPDLSVSYRNGPLLTVECKNVSRQTEKFGNPKIDFQRTRASKGNPCSRYYEQKSFDIVAACLHSVSGRWEFKYVLPFALPTHKTCVGRISSNIRVDAAWTGSASEIFLAAAVARGSAT